MEGNGAEHSRLMNTILSELKERDLKDIRVLEAEEFPPPEKFIHLASQKHHFPDIEAMEGGRLLLYEIETEETFDRPETRERMQTLSGAADHRGGIYFLVVPEQLRDTAQRLMNDLRLNKAEVMGISGRTKV